MTSSVSVRPEDNRRLYDLVSAHYQPGPPVAFVEVPLDHYGRDGAWSYDDMVSAVGGMTPDQFDHLVTVVRDEYRTVVDIDELWEDLGLADPSPLVDALYHLGEEFFGD